MAYTDKILSEKTKISFEMKILTQIYQQNRVCQTESIEIYISEHGTFSFNSIENKEIKTMKAKIYYTMGYNKQVK